MSPRLLTALPLLILIALLPAWPRARADYDADAAKAYVAYAKAVVEMAKAELSRAEKLHHVDVDFISRSELDELRGCHENAVRMLESATRVATAPAVAELYTPSWSTIIFAADSERWTLSTSFHCIGGSASFNRRG